MGILKITLSYQLLQLFVGILVVFLVSFLVLKVYLHYTTTYYRIMDKMNGKTVIITGGNAGIGKETAKEIAKRGARLILACRNMETAALVKDQIIQETNNQNIIIKKLDLSSQKSIRAFAEDIIKTEPKLDVLLHNAGIAEKKLHMTEDHLETTMATNYFGPFLLTHLLIDLLKKSAPSRIVLVASELYRLSSLDLNNINPTSSWFPPYIYYRSKYALISFSNELARRLSDTGVTVNCLHPGLIDTNIWDSAPFILKLPLKCIISCFFKTPQEGCQTSVYLCCSPQVKGVTGKYFAECREKDLSNGAKDMNKAKKLWELTENLVQLKESDPKI